MRICYLTKTFKVVDEADKRKRYFLAFDLEFLDEEQYERKFRLYEFKKKKGYVEIDLTDVPNIIMKNKIKEIIEEEINYNKFGKAYEDFFKLMAKYPILKSFNEIDYCFKRNRKRESSYR